MITVMDNKDQVQEELHHKQVKRNKDVLANDQSETKCDYSDMKKKLKKWFFRFIDQL